MLIVIDDEADRLRMASLEQAHAIFDSGEIGLILIGMPGLEKRMARYLAYSSNMDELAALPEAFRKLALDRFRPSYAVRPRTKWRIKKMTATTSRR